MGGTHPALVTFMIDMDLNLLNSLAALIETRSVSQAARRRRMSQPAMSRALAELRRLFDDPLLVRTRGGMLPTRRAEELAEPLRAWLDGVSRLVARPGVEPATLTRRFRVAASDHGARSVLMPSLAAIMAAAPGVAIDVKPVPADAVARLAGGEIDLLIGSAEPDRSLVHERHLFSETMLCVVRAGHPLAAMAGRAPALEDMLAWPLVGVALSDDEPDPLIHILRAGGLEGRLIATIPYFAAALEIVARSDAAMLLPASAAREHGRDGRLCLLPAPPELGAVDHWLMWHTRGHRDPALQWLIALIAERCRADARTDCSAEGLLQAAE